MRCRGPFHTEVERLAVESARALLLVTEQLELLLSRRSLRAIGHAGRERKKRMEKIVEEFELYGKKYKFETGELAKQATGAVLVSQGDTTILVTSVVSRE